MTSKCEPVSSDTKLQALDEVNKKVKSKTQIAKEYGVPCSTLSTGLFSPIITHTSVPNI